MKIKDTFTYENGNLYWKETFHNKARKGHIVGTKKQNGYYEVQYQYKRYYIHRLIWEYFNGPIPTNQVVDHINGIPYDNRIENLRLLNHNQNLINIDKRSTNKSGYRGISWDKTHQCWVAALSYQGKRVFRKYYKDKEQARIELNLEILKKLGYVESEKEVSHQ